jgi:hypothetical protein
MSSEQLNKEGHPTPLLLLLQPAAAAVLQPTAAAPTNTGTWHSLERDHVLLCVVQLLQVEERDHLLLQPIDTLRWCCVI